MSKPVCTCPDIPAWRYTHCPDCPAYTSCGGWTWDPPCGGCDKCLEDMAAYCREMGSASEAG